jgi:hypothetical protein
LLTKHPNVNIVIGSCYRPEVNENIIVDRICTSINSVDTSNCLLLGDFNFRQINWNSHLVNTSKFYGLMYFVLTPENAQTIQLIYDHSCQRAHLYGIHKVSMNHYQMN